MQKREFVFDEVLLAEPVWGIVTGDVEYSVDNECVTIERVQCRTFNFVWVDDNDEESYVEIDDTTKDMIASTVESSINASELGLSDIYNHCGPITLNVLPNATVI